MEADLWTANRVGPRELRHLAGEHADLLEAAAFLHDIGYAPEVKVTGFHPLDGARYLRNVTDVPELLGMLVANHTCALVEASERGLEEPLAKEFPIGEEPDGRLVAAITYCDLSVGPTGLSTTPQARVEGILSRYQPDDPVHRAIERARPSLLEQFHRVEQHRATAADPHGRRADVVTRRHMTERTQLSSTRHERVLQFPTRGSALACR